MHPTPPSTGEPPLYQNLGRKWLGVTLAFLLALVLFLLVPNLLLRVMLGAAIIVLGPVSVVLAVLWTARWWSSRRQEST